MGQDGANYSEASLVSKLDKLVHTQESINALSYWLLFHNNRAKESVMCWCEQLTKAPPQKKLFFLYLVNDILQQRKKSESFLIEFKKVLPEVFKNSFKFIHPDIKQKVKRMLNVWKERRVYPTPFIQTLEHQADINDLGKGQPQSAKPEQTMTDIPDQLKNIVKNLNSLKALDASKLASVSRINGIRASLFVKESFDNIHDTAALETGSEDVKKAIQLIETYQQLLASEIKARMNVVTDLTLFLQEQSLAVESLNSTKSLMNEKLKHLNNVQETLIGKLSSTSDNTIVDDAMYQSFIRMDEQPVTFNTSSGVHPATLDRIQLGWPNEGLGDFNL
ncbi:hypothetical protein BC833DRAFT_602586 [Globomyces pollinis-pini]|nr:hypothetical protein BC833DRAFT_602586 [Globomyces pollinis-pini]